jgi:hypothetical protein
VKFKPPPSSAEVRINGGIPIRPVCLHDVNRDIVIVVGVKIRKTFLGRKQFANPHML